MGQKTMGPMEGTTKKSKNMRANDSKGWRRKDGSNKMGRADTRQGSHETKTTYWTTLILLRAKANYIRCGQICLGGNQEESPHAHVLIQPVTLSSQWAIGLVS